MKKNIKDAKSEILSLKKIFKNRKNDIFKERYTVKNFKSDMTSLEFFDYRKHPFKIEESINDMEKWYNSFASGFLGRQYGKIFIKHLFTKHFESYLEKNLNIEFGEGKGVTKFIDNIKIDINKCYFEDDVFGERGEEEVATEVTKVDEGSARSSIGTERDYICNFRKQESIKIRIILKKTIDKKILERINGRVSITFKMSKEISDMFMVPHDNLDFRIERRDNGKKFQEAKDKRMKNLEVTFNQIGRLSEKRYYEYDDKDIEDIREKIAVLTSDTMKKFDNNKELPF